MYKTTFKTKNGSLVIENNDIALVSGQEELRQNLENRLSINKNEWFLNTVLGLDYASITGKGIDDKTIELSIRECLFQDDRVARVDNIKIDRNNKERKVFISFNVIDKNGNSEGVSLSL